MRLAHRSCPICENGPVDVLHTQRFALPDGHPLANGYDVVVCLKCGFVYADSPVRQVDYDRFYAEHSKYEDATTGTGGVENPFDWKRQQETAQHIVEFLGAPGTRILDVGCANGGLLKALHELGYRNLCGIDPSRVCVENTRRLGIEAHQGSLFQPFAGHQFDCILLSHTLEHVRDLRGALEWIIARLGPGGTVYLETPDATRYSDFNYAPLQEFNTEHINHFSLACLENLMRTRDFTLEQGIVRTLSAGPQIFYPAVSGFWKQGPEAENRLIKDVQLRTKIEQYIKESLETMTRIELRLQQLLARSPRIIVWGTGQLTMKLLADTSLRGADIRAFVDNNPIHHGGLLLGKPILPPMALADLAEPILIATLLHHQAIADQIRQMRLKNEIVLLLEQK